MAANYFIRLYYCLKKYYYFPKIKQFEKDVYQIIREAKTIGLKNSLPIFKNCVYVLTDLIKKYPRIEAWMSLEMLINNENLISVDKLFGPVIENVNNLIV